MAQELNLLNLKIYVPSAKFTNLRRDLQNKAKIFLLTEAEIKAIHKIGFPEENNNFKEYTDLICEISGLSKKDFNSIGIDHNLLILQKIKTSL